MQPVVPNKAHHLLRIQTNGVLFEIRVRALLLTQIPLGAKEFSSRRWFHDRELFICLVISGQWKAAPAAGANGLIPLSERNFICFLAPRDRHMWWRPQAAFQTTVRPFFLTSRTLMVRQVVTCPDIPQTSLQPSVAKKSLDGASRKDCSKGQTQLEAASFPTLFLLFLPGAQL